MLTSVLPTAPAQLMLQPLPEIGNKPGRGYELRMDQVVRAVVIADKDGQVLLDLNQRRFMAKTDLPLKPGQQLDVRILQTEPQLQLKILPFLSTERIDHLLSALGQQVNWAGQAQQIESMRQQLPSDLRDKLMPAMAFLRQILGKGEGLQGNHLAVLSRLLGLSSEAETASSGALPANLKVGLTVLHNLQQPEQQQAAEAMVKQVYQKIMQLPGDKVGPALNARVEAVVKDLVALKPYLPANQALGVERALTPLKAALHHYRLSPSAPNLQALAQAVGLPLTSEGRTEVFVPRDVKAGLMTLLGRVTSGEVVLQRSPALVADDVRQAVQQLEQLPTEKEALSRAIPQIRSLLERVAALRAELPASQTLLLERPLTALQQALPPANLPLPGPDHLPATEMGWIAAALGTTHAPHFFKTFEGPVDTKTVLEILLGLLATAKSGQGSRETESALQQLEVFQLARSKFQDTAVQLLPLPFPFLEEGYLLAQAPDEGGEEGGGNDPVRRLSLFLRLHALGNLHVDLLQEQGGLYLNVACEKSRVQAFLADRKEQLEQALATLPLHSVTFKQGATNPGAELIRRLRPPEEGVVDARV